MEGGDGLTEHRRAAPLPREDDDELKCAASEDGKVEFVEPPAESEPGERIVCGDMMVAPAGANRVQKKKLMQKAAEELRAIDNVACYQGVPLTAAAGKCTSPTIAAGTIN